MKSKVVIPLVAVAVFAAVLFGVHPRKVEHTAKLTSYEYDNALKTWEKCSEEEVRFETPLPVGPPFPVSIGVSFDTSSAEAANPCTMSTISPNAGAICSLRGNQIYSGGEYIFNDGDAFTAVYTGGCVGWGSFAAARIRDYNYDMNAHQWVYQGYVDVWINTGCESIGGILHQTIIPCWYCSGSFQQVGPPYCPCK